MKAIALLAVCGLAALAGCQVSGRGEVDTRRPSARAEATAGYVMPYEATRETEWVASTDPSATRGTIARGQMVMFDRTPDTSMAWQQAKVNGTVRNVRPGDFSMAANRR